MLKLGRKIGQRLLLDTSNGPIWVEVYEYDRGVVRLAIDAPTSVHITREELLPVEKRRSVMTLTNGNIARHEKAREA